MKQRVTELTAMNAEDRQAIANCLGYALIILLPPTIAILIVYLVLRIGGYL